MSHSTLAHPHIPTPDAASTAPVQAVRAAVCDLATALEDKAARMRAAAADMEARGATLSPLEVMVVLDVHDVRLTDHDLSLHRAVQEATHGLLA